MRRPTPRRRPFPLARLAVAGVGFVVLGVGWKLTSAEPAGAAALAAAESAPTDYVPESSDPGPAPITIDPLAAADDTPAPDPGRPGAPLDFLRVTSSYGMRRHPILGFTRMHQGVDFAAREGAPVLAAADGVVTQAGPAGGYGNFLHIRHAGGWATGYAHLSGFAPGIAPGARVLRGEVVAFVGHTGLATGPHLHFEVSLGGVKLDPMQTPFGGASTPARDPHEGAYAKLRGALPSDTPA
ncbi:MAG TPA: M23 family metallopeptidase [Caulobacteraceae bacterium]|nr:M23 family metallopeptidase [Caulobacteraceae bacterium]